MRSQTAPAFAALLTSLAFLLAAGAATSHADPRLFGVDDPPPALTFAGDAFNLPVGPSVTSDQAVQSALGLSPVRAAMDEFSRRGYLRRADSDTAIFIFGSVPATFAVIAYNKPGLAPGPNHFGAPLILVGTKLLPGGEPTTSCTAGILVVDTLNHVAFSGDSLPELAATDHSFDVGFSSGDPGDPIRLRGPLAVTSSNDTPWTRFNKFIKCAGLSANLCVFRAILAIEINPFAVVLIATNPEAIAATIATCAMYAAATCVIMPGFFE